jgi:cytochrome c oxidase subunit 2
MLAQVPLFPESASAIASRIDGLFFFLVAITGTVAVGVSILIIYFAVRYRRRGSNAKTPRILGSNWLEGLWSGIPMLIFIAMFLWGAQIFLALARPPQDAMEIYVVGKQWMWKIQHPGGQREINQLHVPLGRPVELTLTSEDVIHDFFVPAFRTKIDVLPWRYVHTWFTATKTGRFHLFCSQYCGTNHAGMAGFVEVMEPADFEAWLAERAEGSLALEGRKLFLKLQCITCHSADSRARAPNLENLFGQTVQLRGGGTVLADDSYIRESILDPQAKVTSGWEPIMPTYRGQVDEEDIVKLLAFIKSLQTGGTPSRNEEAEPPAVTPPGASDPSRARKEAEPPTSSATKRGAP